MQLALPRSVQRKIQTPTGEALGISNRWHKGQYCAILTKTGIVGCGIYDVEVCSEFGLAVAIAKGTPSKPLVEPEDLFESKIVRTSEPAQKLGITPGMTGREALDIMLQAEANLPPE
jgi:uncharacterized protein YunC (DUF1805 family)